MTNNELVLTMVKEALNDGAVSWYMKHGCLVAQFTEGREDGLKERRYEPVIPDDPKYDAYFMYRDRYYNGDGMYCLGCYI